MPRSILVRRFKVLMGARYKPADKQGFDHVMLVDVLGAKLYYNNFSLHASRGFCLGSETLRLADGRDSLMLYDLQKISESPAFR